MRHPAEAFIKFMLIKDPNLTNADLLKRIEDWGFLTPQDQYLTFLRLELIPPLGFEPLNRIHRPSMKFLRDHGVYEFFYPTDGTEEAWSILADPTKRLVVEQVILARLDTKIAALKVNKKNNWKLTAEGIETFSRHFWNAKLLTFDEWGKFLYGRSQLYERFMGLLEAPPQLAFHHLRLDQIIESKKMIQRAQEIAYFALEEVGQKPGVGGDKVKAIGILTKSIVECHEALSTSDMALKDVLKQFERFRMEHPNETPPAIGSLAPTGNFSGSGLEQREKEDVDKN